MMTSKGGLAPPDLPSPLARRGIAIAQMSQSISLFSSSQGLRHLVELFSGIDLNLRGSTPSYVYQHSTGRV